MRTVAGRRCRSIGGASLGAISALQVRLAHPEGFGLVLALSPVLADPAIAGYLAGVRQVADPGRSGFLIDFDADPVGSADRVWFAAMVRTAPSNGPQPALIQTPGSRHATLSWVERVVPALRQLLSKPCSD